MSTGAKLKIQVAKPSWGFIKFVLVRFEQMFYGHAALGFWNASKSNPS